MCDQVNLNINGIDVSVTENTSILNACPAHIDIPHFVRKLKKDDGAGTLAVIV